MKSDDTAIPNIPEIKTISPSSTPRDQAINTTSEDRASSSSNTSSSSPSDLRRRLQDLPSPNEFNLLADRVAALGRRICRKRELFLRLQGVVNRIEENDEWEEKEQRAESESSLASSRPKDARARRRARIRLESSPRRDDKAMVISQAGDPTASSKINDHADKSNCAEFPVDRPARDDDHLRLPAIEMRKQPRSSSASEPSSTRLFHRNNHGSRGVKTNAAFHSYRSFTSRDSASRSANPPSVSPFSLSSARPRKFGGYRPSPGVVAKNLSSGSESESANEASRRFCSARKVNNPTATLELSSPESSKAAVINGSAKKMPVVSARSDITKSALPNLLPSTRSLDNDDRRTLQVTPGSCSERVNRDGSAIKISDEPKKSTHDVPEKIICMERVSRDKFATKTSGKFQQDEDTRDRKEEMPQNTSTFSARNFMSESVEFATNICNEHQGGPATRDYNEFKPAESEDENKHGEKEEAENYRSIAPKIYHDDIKGQFDFNCLTERCNLEGSSLENIDEEILDTVKWDLLTNICAKKSVNASHLTERVKSDVMEDALSSQTSEQIESEDQSRSSCTKMYLPRETLSSRRSKNDTDASDKCDQEIAMVTSVPTLALNSQDISYSTSADSRECSATRPLDPHALIKALSDVSLRQERQGESVSRKREDFYRRNKDTIDAANGASNFPTKGETWRVPRTSESPRQPLSRVPSRIPIRISNSRIMSPTSVEKLSCCQKNLENLRIANYEEVNWRNESIEDTIVQARSRIFAPDDEAAEYEVNEEDYEPGSLTFSNLRSPQSASFDTYGKTRRLPESGPSGTSCPSVFFNKTAYSGGRDYAKIDDDVRSRSNYSTSRKSAETLDVTSATESPCLLKYKRNLIPKEFFRDVEENVTWRTEDECPSINDEENPEDAKDKTHYESCGSEPEELYSQTRERFRLASEGMHNLSSSKTQLDLSSEIKRIVAKQRAGDDPEFNIGKKSSFDYNLESEKIAESENLMSQVHRTPEIPNFVARMSSSTLNLNCESKRKKKSQERFPFTISEASGALSTEHKDTSDCQLPDKDFRRTKVNEQLEESTVHQLKMHPSITRLATSGLDDTVADILCCVAEQKEDGTSSKSRIKAFMRIFSKSKLKKNLKQPNDNKTVEPAKIIYENRACQVDSRANSCSGDSSVEEVRRINFKSARDCRTGSITRSNPTFVSSEHTLKTENLEAIAQEYPHRRYDRDDLWVHDVKNPSIDEEQGSKTMQEKNEIEGNDNLKESPSKDRYSIFLAKNFQFDNLSASNSNSKKQHDVISDCVTPSDGKNEENMDRKLPTSFSVPEVEEIEEDLTSCFCWKLCRIIAPSKNRSLIKEQVTSPRIKRSGSPLRKRKK
ncbi:uncharacterized protein [Linepithema humile]|uniref:uncharacterized protein n=1 Tax=Linepithema humile TaxID=83485 RepID=UPI00351F21E9